MLDEAEAAARQEGRERPAPGHVVAEIMVSSGEIIVSSGERC
jgi:hypothetical protein